MRTIIAMICLVVFLNGNHVIAGETNSKRFWSPEELAKFQEQWNLRVDELAEEEFRDAVERCVVYVAGRNMQTFEAYVIPGTLRVRYIGTPLSQFQFEKCMVESGHPLVE